MLATLATGGGLVALGYALRGMLGTSLAQPGPNMDMSLYVELFMRHGELRRRVEEIPGGVRTTTETDAPELVSQLQAHVSAMYANVDQGAEVMCMSGTLPTLFHRAADYQRQLTFTPKGVVAVETSSDPDLTQVIRAHAAEVTGFVIEGMPAMMGPMMGPGMMGPGGMMGPR